PGRGHPALAGRCDGCDYGLRRPAAGATGPERPTGRANRLRLRDAPPGCYPLSGHRPRGGFLPVPVPLRAPTVASSAPKGRWSSRRGESWGVARFMPALSSPAAGSVATHDWSVHPELTG